MSVVQINSVSTLKVSELDQGSFFLRFKHDNDKEQTSYLAIHRQPMLRTTTRRFVSGRFAIGPSHNGMFAIQHRGQYLVLRENNILHWHGIIQKPSFVRNSDKFRLEIPDDFQGCSMFFLLEWQQQTCLRVHTFCNFLATF